MNIETSEHKPTVSADQLLGTTHRDQSLLPFWDRLISFYCVMEQTQINLIGIQEGYIGGKQLNQLLCEIKPLKASFGMDTADLLKDWVVIDWPENAERRKRHEQMGECWRAFARDKMMFWKLINNAYDNSIRLARQWVEEDPNIGVKGVIWWRIKSDNTKEVVFDRLVDQAAYPSYVDIIKRQISLNNNPEILSSTLGVWLLAYFSPEIRGLQSIWPDRDSYPTEYLGSRGIPLDQNMGTTQVGVMALRYADRFLQGRFIRSAEDYILETAK